MLATLFPCINQDSAIVSVYDAKQTAEVQQVFSWHSWSGRGWLALNLHVWTQAAAHAPLRSVTSSNPTQRRQAVWPIANSTRSPAHWLFYIHSHPALGRRASLPLHFLYLVSPPEAKLLPPPASPHLCHCSRAIAASWEVAAESPLA